jgi:hypothetical protein
MRCLLAWIFATICAAGYLKAENAASEQLLMVVLPSHEFMENLGGGGGGVSSMTAVGPIPVGTVAEILRIASELSGQTIGDLMVMYLNGSCTIAPYFNPALPHSDSYIVTIGGTQELIVVLGDL